MLHLYYIRDADVIKQVRLQVHARHHCKVACTKPPFQRQLYYGSILLCFFSENFGRRVEVDVLALTQRVILHQGAYDHADSPMMADPSGAWYGEELFGTFAPTWLRGYRWHEGAELHEVAPPPLVLPTESCGTHMG